MESLFRERLREDESELRSLNSQTDACLAKRTKILDEFYRAVNYQAADTLQSFLALSQTLESAYAIVLPSWPYPRVSKIVARNLFQQRRQKINESIEAVQQELLKSDLNVQNAFTNLMDVEYGLKCHYNGKVLPLQRRVETTKEGLEDDVLELVKQLKEEEAHIGALELRVKQLENERENLNDAINASDKKSKEASETGFFSFILGLIMFFISPIIAVALLVFGGIWGSVSIFATRQRIALEKEIETIQTSIESQKKSISDTKIRLLQLCTLQGECRALSRRISEMSARANQLSQFSREIEELFSKDAVLSTSILICAKELSARFQTMKFKSTQQEVLKLMKMVARNVTTSTEYINILSKATRPQRSKIQNLSCLLEESLKRIETKCPTVSKQLQEDFVQGLHQQIKDIGGCGIREHIWHQILSWSVYLIHHCSVMCFHALCTTLLNHKRFFLCCFGAFLIILAIATGCLIEQALVLAAVSLAWMELSSMNEREKRPLIVQVPAAS